MAQKSNEFSIDNQNASMNEENEQAASCQDVSANVSIPFNRRRRGSSMQGDGFARNLT
jgi:hypothetical protein